MAGSYTYLAAHSNVVCCHVFQCQAVDYEKLGVYCRLCSQLRPRGLQNQPSKVRVIGCAALDPLKNPALSYRPENDFIVGTFAAHIHNRSFMIPNDGFMRQMRPDGP